MLLQLALLGGAFLFFKINFLAVSRRRAVFCRAVRGFVRVGSAFALCRKGIGVLCICSAKIRDAVFGQRDYARRQLADEVSVVADRDKRAVVAGERVLQRFARGDVQVVCRLVKDEKIHVAQNQLREGEPRPLSAGQDGDRLFHILRAEAKLRQRAAYLALRKPGIGVPKLVEHRFRRSQLLIFLVVIAHLHVVAVIDPPVFLLKQTAQKLDKRGLAAAVRTEDENALPLLHLEAETGEQLLLPEAHGKLLYGENVVSAFDSGAERKAD